MKLKSINIRKVDLPNRTYALYIKQEDGNIFSTPFSIEDFVTGKRGDEVDINFLDTIYKFLREFNLINSNDTEIETEELSFEIWDFDQHNFYIAFSNHNITLKVTGFCFLGFHHLKQFYLGEENEFNSIILMFVHPVEKIYCGTGKDIQVMSTHGTDNLLLPNKVLEKSCIKISGGIKTLTLGKFEVSELKKKSSRIVGSKELKVRLYGLNKLGLDIDSNISKLEIGELRIENSIIEGGIFNDCDIKEFHVSNTIFRDTKFYNVSFPKIKEKFLFYRSYVSDCIFSNVNWGHGISDESGSNGEIKETYRMLKYEYDSIGNKTEANKFFAKEMEYYRKSLLENYTWKTFFNFGIGQKRVICWYNQFTNDFGDSWIRPIIWMTILVLFATGYQFLNSTAGFSWNTQILSNILPISEIGKFTTWYNFFYQIAWVALIYQFIVALRRISQR